MLHAPHSLPATDLLHERGVSRLLSRICVRPPYFDLHDITLNPDRTLIAHAAATNPATHESGPMQAGELSRHAAIAGSCVAALAQDDDDRRYYLAREAHFEGFHNPAPYGSTVRFHAELLEINRREVRAHIAATVNDGPLAVLNVLYTVLTEPAFERLFRSRRQNTPPHPTMSAVPAGTTTRDGDTLTRTITSVPPEACAGHFEHYPAMPVAVLMGQLADLAGTTLARAGSTQPYRVARGTVNAADFCWAGETARFTVTAVAHAGTETTFDCHAHADDRTAAGMRLTLTTT